MDGLLQPMHLPFILIGDGLLEPMHVLFIILIVIVLFGPGKLPDLGKGLGPGLRDQLGEGNEYHGVLFMAKGVDPAVGRDVGDMLPDEEVKKSHEWLIFFLAFLLGNLTYVLLAPVLPASARMGPDSGIGLPILVDLGFCTWVYGILKFLTFRRRVPRK